MGEKLTRTTVATLHRVQNQNRAGFVTLLTQGLQKRIGSDLNPANALNAFDDDRTGFVGNTGLSGFDVVKRQERNVFVVVNGGYDGRIVRSGYGSGGSAVERLFESHHVFTTRMERREFQGVFVGFGPELHRNSA